MQSIAKNVLEEIPVRFPSAQKQKEGSVQILNELEDLGEHVLAVGRVGDQEAVVNIFLRELETGKCDNLLGGFGM